MKRPEFFEVAVATAMVLSQEQIYELERELLTATIPDEVKACANAGIVWANPTGYCGRISNLCYRNKEYELGVKFLAYRLAAYMSGRYGGTSGLRRFLDKNKHSKRVREKWGLP